MQEDWNLFERNRDREPVLIFMNTALKQKAPLTGFGQLITIVFNMYRLIYRNYLFWRPKLVGRMTVGERDSLLSSLRN